MARRRPWTRAEAGRMAAESGGQAIDAIGRCARAGQDPAGAATFAMWRGVAYAFAAEAWRCARQALPVAGESGAAVR